MLVRNYLYNLMYQTISLFLPIITIPYVSRVLGAEGLGKHSLTSAYAQYFVIFGMIGLSMYCSREVAYVRDDKENLSKVFWELNILRFITMGISIIIYLLFCIFIVNPEDRVICFIQGFILLSAISDISWLFTGLENFKVVSIRNAIVKLVGAVLVFILIKDGSQIWLYALVINGTQFLGQIIMWIDIPKYIKFRGVELKEIKKHLYFSIKLFIPQIAINIYTMLDKIMLGNLVNEAEVGMYENSQKIIKIAITIVTTLAAVTIPRMANLYKKGEKQEFSNYVYKSFSFVSFLAFPMAFGLIGICRNFIPWFYGKGFEGIELMFYFGSWLMVTLAWSSIFGNQILLAIKRDKKFTISVTIGASLNIIFNMILIKPLGGIGTTISSVIAEFTGMFMMLYFIRDILDIKKLFSIIPKYIISSCIMFLIVWNVGNHVMPTITGTFIQIISGILTYLCIMYLIRDENLMYIINIIKVKLELKKENIRAQKECI